MSCDLKLEITFGDNVNGWLTGRLKGWSASRELGNPLSKF